MSQSTLSNFRIIRTFLCATVFFVTIIVRAVTPPPDGGYPNDNTAEGDNALLSLTSGDANTAVGSSALSSTTTGVENTAVGYSALSNNTDGTDNTAVGSEALAGTGSTNTAVGAHALVSHASGDENTALGAESALQQQPRLWKHCDRRFRSLLR